MKTRAPTSIAAVLALLVVPLLAPPALAQKTRQSGAGPCRIGAQALIAMLDDNDDSSADYRHAFEAVTQTCGPKLSGAPPPARVRDACRALALTLLDVIEEGKMSTQTFARARETFAKTCAPE